jgi:hypothetical protein
MRSCKYLLGWKSKDFHTWKFSALCAASLQQKSFEVSAGSHLERDVHNTLSLILRL